MSDAIVLDVLSSSPVQLDVGDADPIAREEIAELATRVTTVEGDVSGLSTRMGAAESALSTLGTTVDGIDARVEAIEADYVTSEDVMGALGGEAPTLVSGSSRALLGDPETASWMERTTAADGAALIESVKGNTLRWNQMLVLRTISGSTKNVAYSMEDGKVSASTSATLGSTEWVRISDAQVSISSGHKYVINGGSRSKYVAIDFGNITSAYPDTIYTAASSNLVDVTIKWLSGFTGSYDCYPQIFDLTQMFGAGNEPSTVAEFEALFPLPYYPYDPGSLLPVRMEGVETVAADESWSSQRTIPASTYFPQGMRSAGTVYDELRADEAITRVGAVDLGTLNWGYSESTTGNHWFMSQNSPTDIKPSASNDSTANITATLAYEVKTPNRLYAGNTGIGINAANNRIIVVDPSITSVEALKASLSGKTLFYELATPTTTPIDPPLNMTYRAEHGGTERITHTEQSAPPVLSIAYGHTAEGIVQQAASAIAAQDGPTATANHAVGSYLTMGGKLYRVTTAIATGEAITPGTNVTATTVMAEVLSLIQ